MIIYQKQTLSFLCALPRSKGQKVSWKSSSIRWAVFMTTSHPFLHAPFTYSTFFALGVALFWMGYFYSPLHRTRRRRKFPFSSLSVVVIVIFCRSWKHWQREKASLLSSSAVKRTNNRCVLTSLFNVDEHATPFVVGSRDLSVSRIRQEKRYSLVSKRLFLLKNLWRSVRSYFSHIHEMGRRKKGGKLETRE